MISFVLAPIFLLAFSTRYFVFEILCWWKSCFGTCNLLYSLQIFLIVSYVWLTCFRAQPPDYVLKEAKNTSKFFKCIGSVHNIETGEVSMGGRSAYQALTEIEYEAVSIYVTIFIRSGKLISINKSKMYELVSEHLW